MKKLLFILLTGVFFSGCSLAPQKAGIEIITNKPAKVYIDGKEAGATPYKNTSLKPGSLELKLVADSVEWTRQLDLYNFTNTVVDWDFGEDESQSGGYVVTMEKTGDKENAGLIVNASPDKCAIQIDNEMRSFSPAKIDSIGEGDKQIKISFPGYKSLNLFVKGINQYQLVIDAKLAVEAKPIEPVIEEPETTISTSNTAMVRIKETETGWLRVRKEANSDSLEVDKVKPGEKYEVIEEQNGWIKIKTSNDTGWIKAIYSEKVVE